MNLLPNTPGLWFFLLVAGPGLVLLLNQWSLKRVPVTQPDLDWGDDCLDVVFFWPRLSEREATGTRESRIEASSVLPSRQASLPSPPSRSESFEEA